MKKVSIIILLTVLLLSAFTACNGDVFSDLMPEPEPTPKRIITLEIPEGAYWESVSFDDTEDVKTKVLEIPEDCKTWADYLTKVTDVKVYDNYYSKTCMLKEITNKVFFSFNDGLDGAMFGLKDNSAKAIDPPETISSSEKIVLEGTYTLTRPSD